METPQPSPSKARHDVALTPHDMSGQIIEEYNDRLEDEEVTIDEELDIETTINDTHTNAAEDAQQQTHTIEHNGKDNNEHDNESRNGEDIDDHQDENLTDFSLKTSQVANDSKHNIFDNEEGNGKDSVENDMISVVANAESTTEEDSKSIGEDAKEDTTNVSNGEDTNVAIEQNSETPGLRSDENTNSMAEIETKVDQIHIDSKDELKVNDISASNDSDDFDDFQTKGDSDHDDSDDSDFGSFDDALVEEPEIPQGIPQGLPHVPATFSGETLADKEALLGNLDKVLRVVFENVEEKDVQVYDSLLDDRLKERYHKLSAMPRLNPPNWIRLKIRHELLVNLGIPINLDEMGLKEKQVAQASVIDTEIPDFETLGISSEDAEVLMASTSEILSKCETNSMNNTAEKFLLDASEETVDAKLLQLQQDKANLVQLMSVWNNELAEMKKNFDMYESIVQSFTGHQQRLQRDEMMEKLKKLKKKKGKK